MWKAIPDGKSVTPTPSTSPARPVSPVGTGSTSAPLRPAAPATRANENFRAEMAHIGKSVFIKGELSGSEDLYLDGDVEGSIELKQHSLTIGPHGRVHANVHAREVIIHGKLDGNVRGDEKVELTKSAVLMGDVATQRIVIEEGAYFKGSIDIQKEGKGEAAEPKGRAFGAASGAGS